jgi:streptogramin lyase
MLSRLLKRFWSLPPRRARPPVLEALEDRCVPALVPPTPIFTSFQEFALPTAGADPLEITTGPDGNLWFTEYGTNKIGVITAQGVVTDEFPVPTNISPLVEITAGPDHTLWFTEPDRNRIAHIMTDGMVQEFPPLPTEKSQPTGITAGPLGNLWFTEEFGNRIGRITTDDTVFEFPPLPTGVGHPDLSFPLRITVGPDGNLWFTENNAAQIGRITPDGSLTEYPIFGHEAFPAEVTAGPDGNIWFTDGNFIGRVNLKVADPNKAITEFPIPADFPVPGGETVATEITAGPDGCVWFTATENNQFGLIGRITPAGTISEFALPTANAQPFGITLGPDGNLWFTEDNGKIGRLHVTIEQAELPGSEPGVQELLGQVRIRRGALVGLSPGHFHLRLRLVNLGGALEGPLWLALTGLRRKVHLRHPSGLTTHLFPGSPFVDLLPAGAVLPAGGKLNVVLQFSDPAGAPVHFAAHLLGVDLGSLNPQPLPPEVLP